MNLSIYNFHLQNPDSQKCSLPVVLNFTMNLSGKAKKRIESAKLSYEFGHYDRSLGYTKQAFGFSALSFVIGIALIYGLVISLGLYFFL